jgi:hypothetical protein
LFWRLLGRADLDQHGFIAMVELAEVQAQAALTVMNLKHDALLSLLHGFMEQPARRRLHQGSVFSMTTSWPR